MPWLFSLEKNLCTLAGALAAAQFVGPITNPQSELDSWLNESLLEEGYCQTPMPSSSGIAELTMERITTFVNAMSTEENHPFCAKVREAYMKKDMSYRMLLRQAKSDEKVLTP